MTTAPLRYRQTDRQK